MSSRQRIQNLFGKGPQVDAKAIPGSLIRIKGGPSRDEIARVSHIDPNQHTLTAEILSTTTSIELQPGQIEILKPIDEAINEGDFVFVKDTAVFARVTHIEPTRQSYTARHYLEATSEQEEDPDSPTHRGLFETPTETVLTAGQATLPLEHECMVRIENCNCNSRTCKLLGPAAGGPPPLLRLMEFGNFYRNILVPGRATDTVSVLVADKRVLELQKHSHGYNRRIALEKTPRSITRDQLEVSDKEWDKIVMARSGPNISLFEEIPSECLTLIHTAASAKHQFCEVCMAQGSWIDQVCKDPACIEYSGWRRAITRGERGHTQLEEEE
jgi:hypothetical protein